MSLKNDHRQDLTVSGNARTQHFIANKLEATYLNLLFVYLLSELFLRVNALSWIESDCKSDQNYLGFCDNTIIRHGAIYFLAVLSAQDSPALWILDIFFLRCNDE